jgi:hypothetical protein
MRARISTLIVTVAAVAASGAGVAFAQPDQANQPPSQVGAVLDIEGPPGSVLVGRSSQTYELEVGSPIFGGDTIYTRGNGTTTVDFSGLGDCSVAVPPASSIVVNAEVCVTPPTELAADFEIGGSEIGSAGGAAAGGVGGVFGIAGLAAAGVAAAVGASNNDSPTSP